MKEGIHPKYVECKVTCGCGNTFVTRSLRPTLTVEICSSCHPFYSGKQRFVDTEGRVERFKQRFKWTDESRSKAAEKKKKQKAAFGVKFQTATKIPSKKKKAAIDPNEKFEMGSLRKGGGRRGGGR